jgi:prevent-host-death family protein
VPAFKHRLVESKIADAEQKYEQYGHDRRSFYEIFRDKAIVAFRRSAGGWPIGNCGGLQLAGGRRSQYVATVATIGRHAMGVMSIREFNANSSKAIARAEAGEVIDITRNGKPVAELRPKRKNRMDDPEWRAAYERMLERMKTGIPGLHGPATYEERTGR